MISAPSGLVARYKHEHGERRYWTHRRVVAFDDDWQPLVITDDHRLEYASRYANFDGVTDQVDGDHRPYTALMPGGGWRIEYTDPGGSKWSEPLIGWAIKGGDVVPVVSDPDCFADDLGGCSGEYRIYHPDATGPTGPEAGHDRGPA